MKKAITWAGIGIISAAAALATDLPNETLINASMATATDSLKQTFFNPSILGQTWIMPILWIILATIAITQDWNKIKETLFPVGVLLTIAGLKIHPVILVILCVVWVIECLSIEKIGQIFRITEKIPQAAGELWHGTKGYATRQTIKKRRTEGEQALTRKLARNKRYTPTQIEKMIEKRKMLPLTEKEAIAQNMKITRRETKKLTQKKYEQIKEAMSRKEILELAKDAVRNGEFETLAQAIAFYRK